MKINHVPLSHVEVTDTDKLPDIDAMILEKSEELRELCANAKRQVLIIVDSKGAMNGTSMAFWNFGNEKYNDISSDNPTAYAASVNNLLFCTDKWIANITDNQVRIKTNINPNDQ